MKEAGIQKGDTVPIYMPMVPELAFVMLACHALEPCISSFLLVLVVKL